MYKMYFKINLWFVLTFFVNYLLFWWQFDEEMLKVFLIVCQKIVL